MRNVVLIILYDAQKRFLLQHRTSDAQLLPDHWAFFGGGIKAGETPKEALYRETREELNYTPKSPKLVLEQDFREGAVSGRLHIYIEVFRGDTSELKLQEGQGWGWYNETELDRLKMISRDKKIINFIATYLKNEECAQAKQ